MGKRHDPSDITWWSAKILDRVSGRAFNRTVSKYAVTALDKLNLQPGSSIVGARLSDLALQLDIPLKFLPRVIGLLSRYSLVNLTKDNSFTLAISSGLISRPRIVLSADQRRKFFELENYVCGHCLRIFPATSLRIDHIVPLSMLGADAPGNWGALCAKCNGIKLHDFDKQWLRAHRGKRVARTVGVRFQNGKFWPRIDGRVMKNLSLD